MGEGPRFENAPRALDRGWFERFEKHGSFGSITYLQGERAVREEEKRKFESNENRNPRLDYPKLSREDLDAKDEALLALKQDILAQEQHPVVQQAWRWRLNEKIAEVRMLKATAEGNMRKFRRYSEFIFGTPSPDIFSYTISRMHHMISEHRQSENPDVRDAVNELAAALPEHVPPAHAYGLPSPEQIEAAQDQTMKQLGELYTLPDTQESLKADDIKRSFEEALQALRIHGWDVIIDEDSEAIHVNQEKRRVVVPASRETNAANLKGLLFHEIGTHVARRENGIRTKLMLLGLGLDRYVQGEEGVASMREQVVKGAVDDFAGLDGHLAISLAKGLDGTPRDFRDVYDIMQKYELMRLLSRGKDKETAETEAQNYAWTRCVRTFRGTDCSTPGCCYTKDIVYREGNITTWTVLNENKQEALRFNVGKYDAANERHIWILDQLGITDEELDRLE